MNAKFKGAKRKGTALTKNGKIRTTIVLSPKVLREAILVMAWTKRDFSNTIEWLISRAHGRIKEREELINL